MTVTVQFEQLTADFQSDFTQQGDTLSAEFGEIQRSGSIQVDPYGGEYEVKPTLEGIQMETKNKRMVKDTTILPIPIYRVSNNSGGVTVVIGG